MIRGIDVGNYSLKECPDTNIKSLVTKEENILGSKFCLEYENERYFIGEGRFETELNKSTKENFLPLLLSGLAINSNGLNQQVVCGLPINQYKANKESLKDLMLSNRIREIKLNGKSKRIIISDFEVYPEGIGAYYSLNTSDDVIIVDIGGRTTDIAYIVSGKVRASSTIAVGTLNIYKDIADKLNALYSLDLDILIAERIFDRGYVNISGPRVDLDFIVAILKKNFNKINDDLIMKFPAKTEKIVLVGGGYKLFEKAFKNRYPNSCVADNPIFANAIGFQKVGEMLWG